MKIQKISVRKFTLLEVLLSLSILLVLTALAGTVIALIPASGHDLEKRSGELMTFAALDRISDRILRNAVPMTWTDSDHASVPVFKGDPALMITAYRMPANEKGSVGIGFFAMGKRGDTLVAQYRNYPIVWKEKKDPLPETLTEEILLTDVEEFTFLYPVWKNGKFEWLSDWDEESSRSLPRAIGFRIKMKDGRTVKYLRRTAGNSMNTTYGRRTDAWK